jgi:hypothetical protein
MTLASTISDATSNAASLYNTMRWCLCSPILYKFYYPSLCLLCSLRSWRIIEFEEDGWTQESSHCAVEWCHMFGASLTDHARVVIYDHNMFIIQATSFLYMSINDETKKFYNADLRSTSRKPKRGKGSTRWTLARAATCTTSKPTTSTTGKFHPQSLIIFQFCSLVSIHKTSCELLTSIVWVQVPYYKIGHFFFLHFGSR